MYSPNVVFEYEYSGRKYISSSVTVGSGWSSSSSSAAYRVANKYPVGGVVEVAYDPAEPSYGVLETGADLSAYMIYYIGIVFAVIGLLICAYPIIQIVFVLFFIGSSLTTPKDPQATGESRFPEQEFSPVNTSRSTPQPARIPTDSLPSGNIGEGITIQ